MGFVGPDLRRLIKPERDRIREYFPDMIE